MHYVLSLKVKHGIYNCNLLVAFLSYIQFHKNVIQSQKLQVYDLLKDFKPALLYNPIAAILWFLYSFITAATVIYYSGKAALTNPVKRLRTE